MPTYVLNPDGSITNNQDVYVRTPDPDDDNENPISNISKELAEDQHEAISATDNFDDFKTTLNTADDFFWSDSADESFKSLVLKQSKNDPSFGAEETSQDSYRQMYHFWDDSSKHFATEFEMLTGYKGFAADDEGPDTDVFEFILEYFIEIISLLGVMEGVALINSAITSLTSNNTSTVEKFDLRMGKYSIVEYDIFSTYLFTVLNYPKSDSTFLTRIVSFFVGFSAWFSTDNAIDIEKIIEVSSRSYYGTRADENLYDFMGIKNENFIFIGTSLWHVAIALLEMVGSELLSSSSYKRLALLIKKFRQERVWKNKLFKNKAEQNSFLVQFDYYYVRFAIERMHVGLKILNRYAHEKTYLNPKHKESPLTRVSSNRTTEKYSKPAVKPSTTPLDKDGWNELTVKELNGEDFYSWDTTKSDSGGYKPGMTTRLRAVPQILNLSKDFINHLVLSAKDDDNLALDASIMQNFYKQPHKEDRRIQKKLVKQLEDYLEAEYVPFYLHDLRTNEILSFHAFIESISDAFTPEYTSASGFGRIDDVRSYVKTTRNINLSFTVAATSETDHDFMWYQINKLVTMVYPQWSEGLETKDAESKQKFTFPFTQVPTASPLIRLRLGDILKNNYSRSSLSRLFGLAETPEIKNDIFKTNKYDTKYELLPGLYKVESSLSKISEQQYYEVKNPVEVESPSGAFRLDAADIDINDAYEIVELKTKGLKLIVDASKIRKLDPGHSVGLKTTNTDAVNKAKSTFKDFMKPFTGPGFPSNNPITNAYESGMSRGIAGFITQLDINYNESNWETSRIGSKAPMLVKVTLNFAPIHDIAPGIDHSGMMRAPVYNVGRVNNQMFGDPHDNEEGIGSGIAGAITKYDEIKKATEE
jgi:hypothetical protein